MRSNLLGGLHSANTKHSQLRTKPKTSTCRSSTFLLWSARSMDFFFISRILRTVENTALRQDRFPSETPGDVLSKANRNLRTCSLNQTPDILFRTHKQETCLVQTPGSCPRGTGGVVKSPSSMSLMHTFTCETTKP